MILNLLRLSKIKSNFPDFDLEDTLYCFERRAEAKNRAAVNIVVVRARGFRCTSQCGGALLFCCTGGHLHSASWPFLFHFDARYEMIDTQVLAQSRTERDKTTFNCAQDRAQSSAPIGRLQH